MTKANDLTERAMAGYNAGNIPNPFLWSSASHIAFGLGQWLHQTGRSPPRNVHMSRGFSIRTGDMIIAWNKDGKFERIS